VRVRYGLGDWGLLLALMVLWGSAFLFTKIAVGTISPGLVAAGRLAIAALLLMPVTLAVRRRLPAGGRLWMFLILIALFGNALPFSLIAWGQRSIDSGLAGILMAVMPLATLTLAHYLVPGERLTAARVGGFAMGFAGIVVLMRPAAVQQLIAGTGHLVPMLAILAGAMCYSVSAILARLRPASDALSSAAVTTLVAALMLAPFVLGPTVQKPAQPPSALSLMAVVALGVLSTAAGTILYFRLVKSAGPAFVSQLNYLIPLWALLLGVRFLGERPQFRHFVALGLILGGILLAQLEGQHGRRRLDLPGDAGSTV
jgi:drug/metabolite transporter (DMT)-like permease